ncbi:hypothetical protein [Chromobacterium phragmitis]|uniref:Uncharacterized protein n=1 Tax=Chromobacterium phragmitis TaxID=2202141 RepID=A0ABV0IXK0_9NEIS
MSVRLDANYAWNKDLIKGGVAKLCWVTKSLDDLRPWQLGLALSHLFESGNKLVTILQPDMVSLHCGEGVLAREMRRWDVTSDEKLVREIFAILGVCYSEKLPLRYQVEEFIRSKLGDDVRFTLEVCIDSIDAKFQYQQ